MQTVIPNQNPGGARNEGPELNPRSIYLLFGKISIREALPPAHHRPPHGHTRSDVVFKRPH